MSGISVSIVIPSYNSHKTISGTVESLVNSNDYALIKEIIIVDSSDDNATKDLLRSFTDTKLKLIHSGIKVMPSVQRNIGAEQAEGDLLVFIDSDAYAADKWLANIISAYNSGWKAGGGSYLIPDNQRVSRIALAQYYYEFGEFIPSGKMRTKKILPSCNLFCDRSLFLQIGGFPKIRASEDSLFCLKAGELTDLVFIPDAGVYHVFRLDKDDFIRNQFLIGKYIYLYRRKYNNSFFLKKPVFYTLVPFMFVYKSARRVWLVLKAGPVHYLPFVRSFKYFIQGNISWFKGFLRGEKEYDELVQAENMDKGKE